MLDVSDLSFFFVFFSKRQDNTEWKRGASHFKNVNTNNPHADDLLALLLTGLCVVKQTQQASLKCEQC